MEAMDLGNILAFSAIESGLVIVIAETGYRWHNLRGDEAKAQELNEARFKCIVAIILFIFFIIFLIAYSIHTRSGHVEEEEQWGAVTVNSKADDVPMEEKVYRKYVNSTYIGYIDKETESPNGEGTMRYDNGDVYVGNWVNGEREGYGEMKYSNGDVYAGDWKDGVRYGDGTYIWKEGGEYTGEYKNDMRDGEGIYTGWTGYLETYGWIGTYTGMSKNDKFEGEGKFEFSNGDRFEGDFSENELWDGRYIRNDGTEFLIENGVPIG